MKQDVKEVRREDKRKKKAEANMGKNNSFTDIQKVEKFDSTHFFGYSLIKYLLLNVECNKCM